MHAEGVVRILYQNLIILLQGLGRVALSDTSNPCLLRMTLLTSLIRNRSWQNVSLDHDLNLFRCFAFWLDPLSP